MTHTSQSECLTTEELREMDCLIARMMLRSKTTSDREKIDYITGPLGFSFAEMLEMKHKIEGE